MKKILSILLALTLVFSFAFVPTATAAANASINSEDFSFTAKSELDFDAVKEDIAKLNEGKLSVAQFSGKYMGSIRECNIVISGIKNLNDIYGLQFIVSANSEKVALAYVTTNLQNSDKIGVSLWEAYMKHTSNGLNSARVLMYGTKAITSDTNNLVNKISSGKYNVAKIYYFVSPDMEEDFEIEYTIEDIASKNSKGVVESITAEFKATSKCTATYANASSEISPKMLGAQVRVSGQQGLRFGTRIEKDSYFEDCTIEESGTLIAVTNQLGTEELTLNSECEFYNSPAKTLDETDDYFVFTGEITKFPENGDYNTVNFTARSYVEYKTPKGKTQVVYSEPIVRNVDGIKS